MASLNLSKKLQITSSVMEAPNLCDRFTEDDLKILGTRCKQGYVRDLRSRITWERRMNAGMDLAMQIQKEKSFPWPNSSNVIFPLVTIAALQFSARSYTNIIQGVDIVKYRVASEDPSGILAMQAERIGRHMSWQVLEEDVGWEEEHDRLLINLGIVGTNWVKSYYSPSKKHTVSELVMARDFVLDYHAKSTNACARKTQVVVLYRNEIHERFKNKIFRDVSKDDWYNTNPAPAVTNIESDSRKGTNQPYDEEDNPFRTLEQHRYFDLDGDGYAEPYVATIEEGSGQLLRLTARYEKEEDIERDTDRSIIRIRPTEYYTKYSFIPSPDGGIYDLGFGILLGPLNEAVNSGINQLLDSGTMQNSLGGFLGRGAKIRGGIYTMAPWEWKRVDSTGDDLRKNLVPLPDRQPSAVMFNLLGFIVGYVDRIAGTTDPMVGVNPGQNTPAETSRNMIEQGSQVYNMVFKRVWRSMKEEFRLRHILNAMFLPTTLRFGASNEVIRQEDYKTNPDLVVPVADPNITSDAKRVTQAQLLAERSMMVPGYDTIKVERNFLKSLRVDGIDVFFPGPDKVPPLPNPKAQLEEMKMKAKQMDFDHQKQMLILETMQNREKVDAEIMELRARSAAHLAKVGNDRAAVELQAFDSMIELLMGQQERMDKQLEKLQKGDSEGGGASGMGGLAPAASNPTVPSLPQEVPPGANGAMGGGPVQ